MLVVSNVTTENLSIEQGYQEFEMYWTAQQKQVYFYIESILYDGRFLYEGRFQKETPNVITYAKILITSGYNKFSNQYESKDIGNIPDCQNLILQKSAN